MKSSGSGNESIMYPIFRQSHLTMVLIRIFEFIMVWKVLCLLLVQHTVYYIIHYKAMYNLILLGYKLIYVF